MIDFKTYFELFWLDPEKEKPNSLATAMPTYSSKEKVVLVKKREPNKKFGFKEKIFKKTN